MSATRRMRRAHQTSLTTTTNNGAHGAPYQPDITAQNSAGVCR